MTKPAKHSKGPWIFHSGEDYTVILGPDDTTDRPLAEVNSGKIADARLIAAAPDVLSALKLLLADIKDYEPWQRPCHAVDVAEAAIAKAEGRS